MWVSDWTLIHTSHEYIIDHCCEAWNKLIDQPWRIMTIGRLAVPQAQWKSDIHHHHQRIIPGDELK